jgi:hypothetical protein
VELPDMEEITMIYLENNDADYCKSSKNSPIFTRNLENEPSALAFFIDLFRTNKYISHLFVAALSTR